MKAENLNTDTHEAVSISPGKKMLFRVPRMVLRAMHAHRYWLRQWVPVDWYCSNVTPRDPGRKISTTTHASNLMSTPSRVAHLDTREYVRSQCRRLSRRIPLFRTNYINLFVLSRQLHPSVCIVTPMRCCCSAASIKWKDTSVRPWALELLLTTSHGERGIHDELFTRMQQ